MSKNSKLFTFPIEYLYDLLDQADNQVKVVKDLLLDLLIANEENYDDHLSVLMAEILWTNLSILNILNEEIETSVLHEKEGTEEKEFVVANETLLLLQALFVSRHRANLELNKFSYSTSLH